MSASDSLRRRAMDSEETGVALTCSPRLALSALAELDKSREELAAARRLLKQTQDALASAVREAHKA